MAKKKKLSDEDINEALHKMSHEVFDVVADVAHSNIGEAITTAVNKFKDNVNDENRFEFVISPLIAAHASAFADYTYHMGYAKGDILEMICDFYDQAVENDDHDENCPECAAEAANEPSVVPSKKDMN
jgi:hypothetical protein